MALVKTNRSSLFLHQSLTLPVAPAEFIEVNQALVVVPDFATIDTNRLTGAMNAKDASIDTCRTSTAFLASVDMRETGTTTLNVKSGYAELLKISGFEEASAPAIDTYELINSSSNIGRGSAIVYMDDNKFEMTNTLVGSTEMDFQIGQIAKCNTTLSGYMDSAIPVAEANPTVTLSDENLHIVSCLDIVTVDGTVIPAEGIVIATNPDIANTYTMGGASGLKEDTITDYALTCAITFPVDSAVFGREASMIEAGDIVAIRIVIGADTNGLPVDGHSTLFLANTTKAVTYSDTVNNDLLQRVLTLRLYDDGEAPALSIVTGAVSAL